MWGQKEGYKLNFITLTEMPAAAEDIKGEGCMWVGWLIICAVDE